jgi:hypothetical protein
MAKPKLIRKNHEGNYPHFANTANTDHGKAYLILGEEAAQMAWRIIQKMREEPFHRAAFNYTIRKILSVVATELEFEGLTYVLSEGAKSLEDSQEGKLYSHQIITEHPVPMKVIIQKILDEATSVNDCREILKYWSRITLVTREEDALLNSKYQTKMPEDWNGRDVWARYRKMNIKVLTKDY